MPAPADLDEPAARDDRSGFVPGTRGFIVVLSLAMGATALSIDSVLPAFADIRTHLGLADDSTAVAGLITAFIVGNGVGLLPAGLLADRFGRREVMWGGLALYMVGAVGAAFAPSLELMLVARFVWGLGAAGPRVAAMAMIRDAYEGDQMARQMSFVMAVFILVPAFAPSVAAGLLAVGPWQLVFWLCVVAGAAVLALSTRLPATLPVTARAGMSPGELWGSVRLVLATPGTLAYLLALTAMFGAFLSYLASSEIIIDEVFGLATWFPVIFGALALVMGFGMVVNARIVEGIGLDRLVARLVIGYLAAAAGLLLVALATSGRPPLWLFLVGVAAVLICHGVLIPNINSAAMRPLAPVAGTAAAVLGMVPTVGGAVLGSLIDRSFDGSITPLAIGFALSGLIAVISIRRAAVVSPAR